MGARMMQHAGTAARAYVGLAVQVAGWRLALGASLAIALALVEGVGLLLLVPLLGLVGVDLGPGPTGEVAAGLEDLFRAAGLAPTLPLVLGIFVGVSILQSLVLMAQSLTNLRLESDMAARLRTGLYDALVHADWLFLTRQRGSDLAHTLTTEIDRSGGLINQSIALVGGTTQILVAMLVAWRVSPVATAIVSASAALLLLAMRARSARARQLGTGYADESNRLFGVLSDGLAAVRTTKSVGAEDRSVALVAASQRRFVDVWRAAVANHIYGKAAADAASVVGLASVVYLAVQVFALPAGALLVLLLIFARMLPRVIALQQSVHLVLHALPAFERVHQLMQRARAAAEPRGTGVASRLTTSLRFDNVSFAYEPGRAAVDRLSLTVRARAITALVGPSGSGKTTTADLALGLLMPDLGTVSIDGVALTRDSVRAWRTRVAYVSQDPFLFHDTILANLRWADPSASEQAIGEALSMAGAAEFVAKLPDGLMTVVGDRGSRLSGGERQRLAIARALLRRPDLLVLDEPTSALDALNEQRVLETVVQVAATTTVLLVTHRSAAASVAACVYVLDSGRVAESGSPAGVQPALRRTTA
jgi:ATP-binding cassette subfamily C protein